MFGPNVPQEFAEVVAEFVSKEDLEPKIWMGFLLVSFTASPKGYPPKREPYVAFEILFRPLASILLCFGKFQGKYSATSLVFSFGPLLEPSVCTGAALSGGTKFPAHPLHGDQRKVLCASQAHCSQRGSRCRSKCGIPRQESSPWVRWRAPFVRRDYLARTMEDHKLRTSSTEHSPERTSAEFKGAFCRF